MQLASDISIAFQFDYRKNLSPEPASRGHNISGNSSATGLGITTKKPQPNPIYL
jgi:hypothetical protein